MTKLPRFSDDPLENEQLAWMARNPMRDKDSGAERELPKKAPKKEKKRSPSAADAFVDGEVDLHGCTADEAAFKLGEAIALAVSQKWKCLRVIHGGSPGRYGPVQGAVSRMLSQNHRRQVERTQFEPGNTGATLVFLAEGRK